MNFDLLPPRDQIVALMERIYAYGMTTTSGGNISTRDENGDIWITPARLDKGRLHRENIVRMGLDGSFGGDLPPSSEWPFHLGVYEARPDIGAIIHAHPGSLVSFSICGMAPNTRVFPAVWAMCGEVAFASYALPGSRQLGEKIARAFSEKGSPMCVVLENHGVVVGGRNLADAFQRFETLEFAAQTIIRARQLGEVRYLSEKQLASAAASDDLPGGYQPRPPSSIGKELRRELSDFAHRAYSHRLFSSAWGSFSARLGQDAFVITPHGMDRMTLEPDNFVVVRDGLREAGRFPSDSARLHRAIYLAHPEIEAIVNALPAKASAFSISDAVLDSRTIPESYLFLKDIGRVPFAADPSQAVAEMVGPTRPVVLLENNGALVAGRSILDAFDRLEVLETTAAALIRSRALGPITPMSDEVIHELLANFPSV